jgi:hypothetical protein
MDNDAKADGQGPGRPANTFFDKDLDTITPVSPLREARSRDQLRRRRHSRALDTVESVANSMFVLGPQRYHEQGASSLPRRSTSIQRKDSSLPLSKSATLGRNSTFRNLTQEDREILGGVEYRSLRLLLKIVLGMY